MLCIKSPTENYCRVLFMTYWHKFQIIFNGHFIVSSVGRQGAHQGQHFRRAEYCVRCRHGVLSRRNKSNLGVRSQAFRSLSSFQRWKADSIFTQMLLLAFSDVFLVFFFYLPFLSFVTRLGCSLNALSFISWVDTPLTADWLQVCFGTRPWLSFLKHFWKMTYPILTTLTVPCSGVVSDHTTCGTHASHLFKRARAWLNEPHWTRYRAVTLVKWSVLWGSIVLKHESDPLVWVHPKSKWIADSTSQL